MKNFNDYLTEMENMRIGIEVHNEKWNSNLEFSNKKLYDMRLIYNKYKILEKVQLGDTKFYISATFLDEVLADNNIKSLEKIYGKILYFETSITLQSPSFSQTLNNINSDFQEFKRNVLKATSVTTNEIENYRKKLKNYKNEFNIKFINTYNSDLNKILTFWREFPKLFDKESQKIIESNKTYQNIFKIEKNLILLDLKSNEVFKDLEKKLNELQKKLVSK